MSGRYSTAQPTSLWVGINQEHKPLVLVTVDVGLIRPMLEEMLWFDVPVCRGILLVETCGRPIVHSPVRGGSTTPHA